jgi:hypothetical protein
MTRAGDNSTLSDVGVPPAAQRRGGVGALPCLRRGPTRCGGERRQ